MTLMKKYCPVCGADKLEQEPGGGFYRCGACQSRFLSDTVEKECAALSCFGEKEAARLSNARRKLYEAAHNDRVRSETVLSCAREVREIYPDDFLARFYEAAAANDYKALNAYPEGAEDPVYYPEISHYLIQSLRRKNSQIKRAEAAVRKAEKAARMAEAGAVRRAKEDTLAIYKMGMNYLDVWGYEKAFPYLEIAAMQGLIEAQCIVSGCYYCGDGAEKDYQKAVEWCREAALQGYARAQ